MNRSWFKKLALTAVKLLGRIAVDDRSVSDEERAFVIDWVDRHTSRLNIRAVSWAAALMLLAIIPLYLMSPEPARTIQITTHAVTAFVLTLWQWFARRDRYLQWLILVVVVLFATGYAISIYVGFSNGPSVRAMIILPSIYAVIAIFCVIEFPYRGPWVLLASGYYTVVGLFAFKSLTAEVGMAWLSAMLVQQAFAVNIYYGRMNRTWREGLSEFRARKLIAQNERLRRESLEKDLALAQEIQDSFAPPESFSYGDIKIDFFQSKHDHLGGDWFAFKQNHDGSIAILVADATGKSIGAALVIHAVQSLWALSLNEDEFDPEGWIQGVNRSLLALGQKSSHSLTLGLVHLSGSTLTYYSAGHIPIVMVRETSSGSVLDFLQSRGDILGINPHAYLAPMSIDFKAQMISTLLIATDGVIDKGIRTKKRFISQLLTDLNRDGARALDSCLTDDDKLLVRLQLTL